MKTIVHVGLPKCASTSLQALFARTRGTTFLGKRPEPSASGRIVFFVRAQIFGKEPGERAGFATDDLRIAVRRTIPGERALAEADFRAARLAVDEAVAGLGARSDRILLSDEVMSGCGFVHFDRPRRSLPDIVEVLGRLFGPDLLVIVVVREQTSFLRSYWKHLVRTGYPFTFAHFLARQSSDPGAANAGPSVTSGLFFDHARRSAIASGVRVAFVPFEDVVGGNRLLRELLAGEGVALPGALPHRNRSWSDAELLSALKHNREHFEGHGRRYAPADVAGDEEAFRRLLSGAEPAEVAAERSRLVEAFRSENRAFSVATGIDLGAWNYPV